MNRPSRAVVLVSVALLSAAVLVLTAGNQIYDANFTFLSEATSLLAGDHPYRDIFEPGVPLAAYLSAGAQLIVGYRLIGEFVLHWLFMIAGVVIAFHLGLRLSRSLAASLAVLPLVLILLARTPTYHYPKLFFFPLTIWLAWRYLDRPGVGRSATLGAVSAVGFLFRHDYGVYLGWTSMLALAFACIGGPSRPALRPFARDAGAYLATVIVLLAPWAIVVERNEGLVAFVQLRASRFEGSIGASYKSLLTFNPIRELTAAPPEGPRRGVVAFAWQSDLDEVYQRQLEQQYGLRSLGPRDSAGRVRYEVSNLYNPALLALDAHIHDSEGFQWERLQETRLGLPSRANVALWLEQMALAVPIVLLGAAVVQAWRTRVRAGAGVPSEAWTMAHAAVALLLVDAALLREPGYVVTVSPVTAALGSRFVAWTTTRWTAFSAARWLVAVSMLLLTTFAAAVWGRDTASGWSSFIAPPSEVTDSVASAFARLTIVPPVDGSGSQAFRYLYDCTAPGDRLLVGGHNPLHVSYYAQRPIAGGHLMWSLGWASDPVREGKSLALLERQSVPFAVSTSDPVREVFAKYPRIGAYLLEHYVELEGTEGLILVDARRKAIRRYGSLNWPCFR